MSKKVKVILSIFVVLITMLIVLIILPFVIDLNRFKPQIQEAVSKQVNAKIDFTSIQLTIFSGLGFKLENVSIENTDPHFVNTPLFKVKEIKFRTELRPLLRKKIVGYIEINSPNIKLLKEGELTNIATLIKSKSTAPESSPKGAATEPAKNQTDTAVKTEKENKVEPSFADKKEMPQNENSFSKNILIKSFVIKNADISYFDKAKKEPILIKNLNLNISNIGLDKDMELLFSTNVNVKETDYTLNGPVSLKIIAKTSLESEKWKNSTFIGEVNLDALSINFENAFVKSNKIPFHFSFGGEATPESLVLKNFMLTLQSLSLQGNVELHDFQKLQSKITLNLSSKNVSSLAEILPQHKNLLSQGTFNLNSNIQGNLSNTDLLKSSTKLSANLYNSDIILEVDESSIKPTTANLHAKSTNLNLGEILKPFMSSSTISFQKLKFHNLILDTSIANNVLNVQKLNFDAFKGGLASNFTANLGQDPLVYSGKMNFNHIEIQDLIQLVQMKQQSPVEGVTDLIFNFNGKGTTREIISKTLNVKGTYAFYSGKLNVKSIMSLASEQLQKLAANLNIPGFTTGLSKASAIDLGQNAQRGLKNAKGDFEIKNGKIIINNLIASDQGNIQMNATVGLDESLGGTALYTATKQVNNLLVAQNKRFAYFFDKKGNFQLNLILGGTLTNPNVMIDPKNLEKNIMNNTTQALRDKAVSKLKEHIKENPEVEKATEGAKKLLKEKGLDLSKFGF